MRSALRIVFWGALATVVLLIPARSRAESDQRLVLHCSFKAGGGADLIIDLSAKTVSNTLTNPNPGGSPDPIVSQFQGTVTEVTADTIKLNFDTPKTGAYLTAEYVLNRFTGNLDITQNGMTLRGTPCQREQKQF